jgi:hypothetical protein
MFVKNKSFQLTLFLEPTHRVEHRKELHLGWLWPLRIIV